MHVTTTTRDRDTRETASIISLSLVVYPTVHSSSSAQYCRGDVVLEFWSAPTSAAPKMQCIPGL